VTTGTLQEMHWEVLPQPVYSPDLTPSDFHLFGPLIWGLGGKRFRAEDEDKYFMQRWLDEQQQTFLKGHNKATRTMTSVYRSLGRKLAK
jgi:hypothetical protein